MGKFEGRGGWEVSCSVTGEKMWTIVEVVGGLRKVHIEKSAESVECHGERFSIDRDSDGIGRAESHRLEAV